MNVLSLFDGESGGQLAFERIGVIFDGANNKYYASEIEQSSINICIKHYPNTIQLGDITKLDENKLKELPKIDLIIGGSPCTQLSRQGNIDGLYGKDSILFFEYVRIYKWLKENNNKNISMFLENVEMKKIWENEMSYNLGCNPIHVNSKLVSAQNRPRLYWSNIELKPPKDRNIIFEDILEDVDTTNYIKYKGLLIDPKIKEVNYNLIDVVDGEVRVRQAVKKGYIVAEEGDGINLSFPTSKTRRGRVIKRKTNTLDTGCNVCVYYNGVIRYITTLEAERLQTLPDNYTCGINDKDRRKMIGNGWTIDIISHFFKQIIKNVINE